MMRKSLVVFFVFLMAGSAFGRIREERGTQAPEGVLSPADWDAIQKEYDRQRHAAFAVGNEYHARSFGQQWLTRFDGRGFVVEPDSRAWNWGLALTGYGYAGQVRPVARTARMTAAMGRVSYAWGDGLEEWFVNSFDGLEHGLTLRARPGGGTGRLEFAFAVRGELHAEVDANGRAASFVTAEGRTALRYKELKVTDARGRLLAARLVAAGQALRLVVDDAGAVYPIEVDPIAQQAYIKSSSPSSPAQLGRVAISGDTVVIGAHGESSKARGVNGNQSDNSMPYAGAAYVFVRNSGTWTQQAYLKASNTAASTYFGFVVGISGDTIVVGSYGEASNVIGVNGNQNDTSAPISGAAYVFVRKDGVWSQQAYLKASNSEAGDQFGFSVGISGDTIVAGAPGEASSATGVNGNQGNGASFSGAAYVFVRNGGVWSQQAYLKASNAEASDLFGVSVAIFGDTLVVGARLESSNAVGVNGNQSNNASQGAGAAYVFVRTGGIWAQQAYLKASNAETLDRFGATVAITSDTIVVGAIAEASSATTVNGNQADNSAAQQGAAYVFVRTAGGWTQQAYLKGSRGRANDHFGDAVAISGDTIVVGAPGDGNSAAGVNPVGVSLTASSAGAVYVFTRVAGAWSEAAYLKASNAAALQTFGQNVAIAGDTIAVGANGEGGGSAGVNGDQSNQSIANAGAAYVFTGQTQPGGLRFVPMTPCRVVDTRTAYAGPRTGGFGPPFLTISSTRTITIPLSPTCSVPTSAKAYVFNVTLDTVENQTGAVDYVTIWPAGDPRPEFYTARTTTGGYIANAAIVKAGTAGAVNVYASNNVNLILDINGYFTDDGNAPGLLYYPMNPCRAVDTRGPVYSSLPPPYGNQRMQARENRTLRLPGSPACQIPAAAAYSLQLTLAPGELTNGSPVAFLTAYPTGVAQPNISTMNALFGYAVANSAIVPAGAGGSIDLYAYDATNVIVDVNGYFAPDDGTGRGLYYHPATQCRVLNTQDAQYTGVYGQPMLTPAVDRTVPVAYGRCAGLPDDARAWALNASVVPNGVTMPYLSLWPSGTAWPNISQLNAFQGQTLANSGIVPASSNGMVDVRVAGTTQVVLEVSGYFSR